jgi:aminoglycoside phosphotransferase
MDKIPAVKSENDFNEHFQNEIWLEAVKQICSRHQISYRELKRSASSDHIVFLIDDSLVVKIYRPFRQCFEREKKALEFVFGKTNFNIPEIVQIGEIADLDYIVMTQLSGGTVLRSDWLTLPTNEQIDFITKLAVGMKQIHELNAESFVCNWAEFVEDRANTFIERQLTHGVNSNIIKSLPAFIEANLKLVPKYDRTVFMHSDMHFGNLCLSRSNDKWQISGLFDFADSRRGFHEYDFLAVGLLIMQGQAEIQREFFKGYGYAENELDETFRKRLMMLTMLYETSDLRRYAIRLNPEAVEYSLEKLEKEIWNFV